MAAAVVMSCYVLRHTQSLSIRISIATTNILSVSNKVFWLHFPYFMFVNKQTIQSGKFHNHIVRDLIRSVFLLLFGANLVGLQADVLPPDFSAAVQRSLTETIREKLQLEDDNDQDILGESSYYFAYSNIVSVSRY